MSGRTTGRPAAVALGDPYLKVAYTCRDAEKTCLVNRSYQALEAIAGVLADRRARPVVLDARLRNDHELRYLLEVYGLDTAVAPARLPEAIVEATRRLGPARFHVARLLRRMYAYPPLRNLLQPQPPGLHTDPNKMQLHLRLEPSDRRR